MRITLNELYNLDGNIIVGVILETVKQIESMMVVRNYKGFLNS